MSKSKKDLAMAMSGQQSFLDKLKPEPGDLNISLRIRDAISQALRKSKLSRYQIAALMSELTGSDISKTMLDAYSADSKEYHRFPLEWVPAFIRATGDEAILKAVAEAAGCQVVSGDEAVYAEIARLERQEEEIRRKKEILRKGIR